MRPMIRQGLLALTWAPLVGATSIPFESPWLCSVVHVVECNADRECSENSPEVLADLGSFFSIDLDAGVIASAGPRSSDRSARILESSHEDGRLMLAGLQGGRGWSLTLVEDTGEVSLAISDPDGAILVFGSCMATESDGP